MHRTLSPTQPCPGTQRLEVNLVWIGCLCFQCLLRNNWNMILNNLKNTYLNLTRYHYLFIMQINYCWQTSDLHPGLLWRLSKVVICEHLMGLHCSCWPPYQRHFHSWWLYDMFIIVHMFLWPASMSLTAGSSGGRAEGSVCGATVSDGGAAASASDGTWSDTGSGFSDCWFLTVSVITPTGWNSGVTGLSWRYVRGVASLTCCLAYIMSLDCYFIQVEWVQLSS